MRLTSEQILFLLEMLRQKTIVEPTRDFPYRITCDVSGYSEDPKVGPLQAKLSIMLEVAREMEK